MMANTYDLSEEKIENIAAYLATVTNGCGIDCIKAFLRAPD
jgi:cytochrome c553